MTPPDGRASVSTSGGESDSREEKSRWAKEIEMEDASRFHNLHDEGILRQLAPGIVARIFPGINVMLSVVTIEPYSSSPVHSHPNEQWGVCLEGEWIRIQNGVDHSVKAGDFWQTPPDVPHGGRTLDHRCVVLDIFAPPREEYRQGGQGLGTATMTD
jgi:unsaturated pyranuronate lyase